MEIHAKCKYDLDAITAFTHVTMYKREEPLKRLIFWSVIFLFPLTLVVFDLMVFGAEPMLFVLIACTALMYFFLYFGYFVTPRRTYHSMAAMKNVENIYVFYEDKMLVSSCNEMHSGNSETAYSALVKVYETSAYFFLYQTVNQAFIVDKGTIENGTAEDIRAKLMMYVGNKYFICKY